VTGRRCRRSQRPTPERIALFRGVLASNAKDPLKSYDLVWLLHLVGDVHQPLHCATRVSSGGPDGDDGGNTVKLNCTGCPAKLHTFWDDVPGSAKTVKAALNPVISAAKKVPTPDPTLAAKTDEKVWIAESFNDAQTVAYQPPIMAGNGPFSLTTTYKDQAHTLAQRRVALAGARLANLLNSELK